MRNLVNFCLSAAIAFSFISCGPETKFEVWKKFEVNEWKLSDSLIQDFEVTNTNQNYNLITSLKVNENCPTYNCYIKLKIREVKNNKNLFESLYSLEMFDQETGKPIGTKEDNYNARSFEILKDLRFQNVGTYRAVIIQYNRFEPMTGIGSIGLEMLESDN